MRRTPLYREPAEAVVRPAEPDPGSPWFPWSTVIPLAVMVLAGALRSLFAFVQGGRWGAEPSLAFLLAGVATLLIVSDVRAWRRVCSRPAPPET